MNHHEGDNPLRMKPNGQARPKEIHIRDAETKCERSKLK